MVIARPCLFGPGAMVSAQAAGVKAPSARTGDPTGPVAQLPKDWPPRGRAAQACPFEL
jgi:hypothetical protein